jgi:hypothetical protein
MHRPDWLEKEGMKKTCKISADCPPRQGNLHQQQHFNSCHQTSFLKLAVACCA